MIPAKRVFHHISRFSYIRFVSGDRYYILIGGSVSIRLQIERDKKDTLDGVLPSTELQVLSMNKPGSSFGEIAIKQNGIRKASAIITSVNTFCYWTLNLNFQRLFDV